MTDLQPEPESNSPDNDEFLSVLKLTTFRLTDEYIKTVDTFDLKDHCHYWGDDGFADTKLVFVVTCPQWPLIRSVLDRGGATGKKPIVYRNMLMFPYHDKEVQSLINQINIESMFKNMSTLHSIVQNK